MSWHIICLDEWRIAHTAYIINVHICVMRIMHNVWMISNMCVYCACDKQLAFALSHVISDSRAERHLLLAWPHASSQHKCTYLVVFTSLIAWFYFAHNVQARLYFLRKRCFIYDYSKSQSSHAMWLSDGLHLCAHVQRTSSEQHGYVDEGNKSRNLWHRSSHSRSHPSFKLSDRASVVTENFAFWPLFVDENISRLLVRHHSTPSSLVPCFLTFSLTTRRIW